jgi:hypothetical protein
MFIHQRMQTLGWLKHTRNVVVDIEKEKVTK